MDFAACWISDLHLQSIEDPHTRILLDFLAGDARRARRVYVLGDLFEAYVGDDDDDPLIGRVREAFAALSAQGVELAFQHGNRDFLLGRDFARRAGMRLLPDPCVIDLCGRPVLLSHGDRYCIDDEAYQKVRAQLRDPVWQQAFLARPLAERRQFAAQARAASAAHQQGAAQQGADMAIFDVNEACVLGELRLFGIDRLIHGHTHRPARHTYPIDGRQAERWVLADWRGEGEALVADSAGQLSRLPLRG